MERMDSPNGESSIIDYKVEHCLQRRYSVRLQGKDLAALFGMKEVLVTISTDKITVTESLLNISQSGMAVQLPFLLEMGLPLKVGFLIGGNKINSDARVMQISQRGTKCVVGIMFVDLAKEFAEYINGIICIEELLCNLGDCRHKKVTFFRPSECFSDHKTFSDTVDPHNNTGRFQGAQLPQQGSSPVCRPMMLL